MNNSVKTSVVVIQEAIDFTRGLIAKLTEQSNEAMNNYSQLVASNALASQNINSVIGEIKAKISHLQSDFEETAAALKAEMATMSDTVSAETSSIESTLQS